MSERPTPAEVMASGVVIVLVNPIHPGNVGQVARAMMNMGLGELVIVDPPCFDLERARMRAAGGRPLLDRMRIVGSVAEAVEVAGASDERRAGVAEGDHQGAPTGASPSTITTAEA